MNHQTQNHIEIEIKSLLGQKQKADALRQQLLERQAELIEKSNQLNHYFISTDLSKLYADILQHIPDDQKNMLDRVIREGENHSVRTRFVNNELDENSNGDVLFIIKASIDDTTSSNGISRIEFEVETPKLTIEELDQILLNAGLSYQAKWSRKRKAYEYRHQPLATSNQSEEDQKILVCIDKNAGYGYLAEFEKIISDPERVDEEKQALRDLMDEFGVEELEQDRLERMFAHYNQNWQDYYGTEKVFVIE